MSSRIGKIQAAWNSTGSTLYAIIRNAIAQSWNVGGATFEAFNVANWSQYAVPMTEQGALSQFYVADLPAGAESYYTATVYEQAGVGPAVADTLVEVVRAVQLADDVPHGGIPGSGTATLALEWINVNNPAGDAIDLSAQFDCIFLSPNQGACLNLSGGNNVPALNIGGGTGQPAVTLSGSPALDCQGQGSSGGVRINNGLAGPGLLIATTSGPAVSLTPTDGDGISVAPTLNAVPFATGISVLGVGTAPAVQLGDGTNGGIGLNILAGAGSGTGAAGVNIVGNLQGDGVDITGGATDATGMVIAKGGTLGNALEISGGQHAILLETINSSVILANGNNTFMTANLVGGGEYLRVNSFISVDNIGRHRIQSSLTNDDALLAFPFLMTDLAGNPKTGLTVTSTVILDGAAPVPTVNSPVEIGNGVYAIDLDASDRAGTTMMLRFTAPNARDLDIAIINTA